MNAAAKQFSVPILATSFLGLAVVAITGISINLPGSHSAGPQISAVNVDLSSGATDDPHRMQAYDDLFKLETEQGQHEGEKR